MLQNSKSVALDDRGIEAVAGPKDLKQFSNSGICAPIQRVQSSLFEGRKFAVPELPALYPDFHAYFRNYQPPFLAVWGKNGPFFLPAEAKAFKGDIPNADVRFFDTGHFALETHCAEIAAAIRDFLDRMIPPLIRQRATSSVP